jgi:hypothetical protein
VSVPNSGIDRSPTSGRQRDSSEVIDKPVPTQGHLAHPHRLDGHPTALVSVIRGAATRIGHQTIIVLLQTDRVVGNAKQRLVQGIQRFGVQHYLKPLPKTSAVRHLPSGLGFAVRSRGSGTKPSFYFSGPIELSGTQNRDWSEGSKGSDAHSFPTTIEDAHHQPLVPRNSLGLLVRVRNLEVLRNRNADNARCVCWVLRRITDPEAIDSDIRLTGTIRWFDGNSNHDPPFDLIVSAFEECFDATKQLYPGMRDRAYFSALAILKISMRARAQSHQRASKYPIPAVSSSSVQQTDPDLHHVIRMLECNLDCAKPTLEFPKSTNTRAHSLWMSDLFVDLTRVGPNPILRSYESYLSVAAADHQAIVANTLIMWYMFLGGHVEEETFWAIDKS